jgi:hypothetical protein
MWAWKNVLGYAKGNTRNNVRRKFKALAKQTHPDKNPGIDPELFRLVKAAMNDAERYFANRSSSPPPRRAASPPRRTRPASPPRPRRAASPPRRSNSSNSNSNTWRPRANARRAGSPAWVPTPSIPVHRVGLSTQTFRGFMRPAAQPQPVRFPRSIVPPAGSRLRPRRSNVARARPDNNNAVPMNWE